MFIRGLLVLAVLGCAAASCTRTGGKAAVRLRPYAKASADTAGCADGKRVLPETFTVALTGDIMMGTTYPDSVLPADDGRALFNDVRPILLGADIAAGNLEGTFCDTTCSTRKTLSGYNYAFRTPPEYAMRLKEAGYDFVSIANNHTNDFGPAGIRSTEQALDRAGVRYAGLPGRCEMAVVERRGVKFGLCAFGHNAHTLRHYETARVKVILDSLRSVADIVVVSFHGGAEGTAYSHLPYGKEEYLGENRGALRHFARFCIDNGADIVFGHGPHVVRCVELYRGRFIAYSLGNFCTPYGISILGVSGYAPVIEVTTDRGGRFLGGMIHSFVQRRGLGPRRDTANIVVRQVRKLTAADIPDGHLKILDDGRIVVAAAVGQ